LASLRDAVGPNPQGRGVVTIPESSESLRQGGIGVN
jgi:hypothetical protein